jgi:hypothetical protein
MHISQAQPIALAGRNEGSRSDCNADRRGLKSASCLAWLLMGKGLNEYLEDQEFIHRLENVSSFPKIANTSQAIQLYMERSRRRRQRQQQYP